MRVNTDYIHSTKGRSSYLSWNDIAGSPTIIYKPSQSWKLIWNLITQVILREQLVVFHSWRVCLTEGTFDGLPSSSAVIAYLSVVFLHSEPAVSDEDPLLVRLHVSHDHVVHEPAAHVALARVVVPDTSIVQVAERPANSERCNQQFCSATAHAHLFVSDTDFNKIPSTQGLLTTRTLTKFPPHKGSSLSSFQGGTTLWRAGNSSVLVSWCFMLNQPLQIIPGLEYFTAIVAAMLSVNFFSDRLAFYLFLPTGKCFVVPANQKRADISIMTLLLLVGRTQILLHRCNNPIHGFRNSLWEQPQQKQVRRSFISVTRKTGNGFRGELAFKLWIERF